MDESDYQLWNNVGEALRQLVIPDLQGALTAYRRAAELVTARLETTPDDVGLLIDLASYRVQLGDEVAARELLPRILTLGVTSSKQMFDLAAVYEELGEHDDAIDWLGRALEAGFPLQLIKSYDVFEELLEDPRFRKMAAKFSKPAAETADDGSAQGKTQ
jgi:tetratricopeptide (TPR) repeat protein